MRAAWVVGLALLAAGCAGRLFYLPDPDGRAAWSQTGGGPAALAFCAAAPAPPLQLRWQQKLSAAPLGGGLVDGGLLLQVTAGPTLLAFDRASGRVLGRRGLSAPQSAAGVLLGPLLVVGEAGPKPALRAYDRRANRVRWSHAGLVRAPLCGRGDTVVAALNAGQVVALAAGTGKVLWQASLAGPLWTGLALGPDAVYTGDGEGRLVALDLATGAQRWALDLGGVLRALAVQDSVVYAATTLGEVLACEAATGQRLWTRALGALPTAGMALVGERLVLGAADHQVYGLDRRTGERRWQFATRGVVSGAPGAAGATVYVGSSEGFLYALEPDTGRLAWKYQLDGPALMPVALAPDLVAVATEEKTLYVFGR
ncbi:MAG: PQQ-like beta-propeller repeat protein [Candidatus Latescibacteria bacterium]|nr:PQQ-like beta-propeller repeat protein [Candidatus Latescibacterota bacterium]